MRVHVPVLVTLCLANCTPPGSSGADDDRGGGTAGASGGAAGEPAAGASGAGGDHPPGAGGASGGAGGAPPGGGAGGAPMTAGCVAGNVCDDFEQGMVGRLPAGWGRDASPGAKVQVDDSKAFSGSQSFYFEVPSGKGKALTFKTRAPLFPLPDNRMFGRMMVYVDSTPTDSVHWTNIEALGKVPDRFGARYRYGGQHGHVMANYITEGDVLSDCFKHSEVALPLQRWFCVRWEFNGPANEMRIWLDGQEIEALHVTGRGQGCVHPYTEPWYAPEFEVLNLGWQQHQDTAPRKMWIDDVSVGASASPCPQGN